MGLMGNARWWRYALWLAAASMAPGSGCGGVEAEAGACGDAPVTPACNADLDSESACNAEGGCWGRLGNANLEGCTCPTTDGGKACSRKTDCQGACVIERAEDTTGKCAEMMDTVPGGCQLDADGKAECVQL